MANHIYGMSCAQHPTSSHTVARPLFCPKELRFGEIADLINSGFLLSQAFFSLLVRDPACFFLGGDFRQCIFALKTRIILRVLLLLKPKFKLYFFYNFFFNNFVLKI